MIRNTNVDDTTNALPFAKHVLAEVPSTPTKKEKRKIYQDNYNRINKDKQAVFKQRYKDENREKVRKQARKRYNDNKDFLAKQTAQKQKYYADTLHDAYMKQHLRKLGYKKEEITKYPEIKETIKLIIKTKRLCKTSQN
ncbi:MAG: hypothetical protein IM600_18585 [Bacteroidetes bacterium]|nr:hypothetical protein [Bacteroidota bacterium]